MEAIVTDRDWASIPPDERLTLAYFDAHCTVQGLRGPYGHDLSTLHRDRWARLLSDGVTCRKAVRVAYVRPVVYGPCGGLVPLGRALCSYHQRRAGLPVLPRGGSHPDPRLLVGG